MAQHIFKRNALAVLSKEILVICLGPVAECGQTMNVLKSPVVKAIRVDGCELYINMGQMFKCQ